MKTLFTATAVMLVLVFALIGCGQDKVDEAKSGISTQLNDVADKAQDEYKKMTEGKLEGLEKKMDDLRVQVDKLPDVAKTEAHAQLDKIEVTLEDAKNKVKNLDALSADSWGEMKTSLDKAVSEMDEGMDKINKLLSDNM